MEQTIKIDGRRMGKDSFKPLHPGEYVCKCKEPFQLHLSDDFCIKCGYRINYKKRAEDNFKKSNIKYKKNNPDSEGLFNYLEIPNNWVADESDPCNDIKSRRKR